MFIFQTKKEFNKAGVVEDTWDDLQAQSCDELASPDSEEVREAKKRWGIEERHVQGSGVK